ncbi:hypothetical protein Naga_100538g1 [Nannochloropsis gaditana]|uniref:Uncharacterized protein n=1 Tax=Nannochloropsis gaditana TaxID=72520 RepID=W7TCI9_9STRA|nr:hypothetical protein Naga_100538g1 [Nannochloropsis gaditana]
MWDLSNRIGEVWCTGSADPVNLHHPQDRFKRRVVASHIMPAAAINGHGPSAGAGGGDMDPELAHAEETLLMMKKAPAGTSASSVGRRSGFHIPPMTPTGATFHGRRGGVGRSGGKGSPSICANGARRRVCSEA